MRVIRQRYFVAVVLVLFGNHAAVFAQTQLPPISFVQASNVACKVGRANVKPGETVTFQGGGCADELAQGPGLAQWYLDGKPTLRFVGIYARGLLEGKATMTGADGDRYEGEYKGGLRNGHGIYISANGARFEGEYRNNLRMEPGTVSAVPPQPQATQPATTTSTTQRTEGAIVPAPTPNPPTASAPQPTATATSPPSRATSGQARPSEAAEDIVGLKIGMTPAEVRLALPKINPKFKIREYRDRGWNALVIEAKEEPNVNELIVLKFTETDPRAWFVGRSVGFAQGQRPTRAVLNKELSEKYGKPSQGLEASFYADGSRAPPSSFGDDFAWAWASNRHQEFASSLGLKACAHGSNDRGSWGAAYGSPLFFLRPVSRDCSKLIEAQSVATHDNPNIAGGISVAITDFELEIGDPKHPANVAATKEQQQIEEARKNKPKL